MSVFLIILIATVSLVILIIFILGVVLQFSIIRYNKTEAKIKSSMEKIAKEYQKLEPIKSKWELKNNEVLYYESELTPFYKAHKKELAKNKIFSNQDKVKNYQLYNLSGYLQLRSQNFSKNEVLEGIIYLTNKRILVNGEKYNKSIAFDNIKLIAPSIFHVNGQYHAGFVVFSEKNIYKGITDDIKISKIAYLLLKESRK